MRTLKGLLLWALLLVVVCINRVGGIVCPQKEADTIIVGGLANNGERCWKNLSIDGPGRW
jgi:hypothetical protein